MLTRLLNDLERLLQHNIVLILDDVHALTTKESQALLLFLLNHLPSPLHLLLGTRVDPPRLARLRARQQIFELPREALGFTLAEVEAFAHVMELPLGSEAIRLLEERTEGWIAGVQLLALALRGHADATLRTSQPHDPEEIIEHLSLLLKTHEKDDPEAQAELQRELALQNERRIHQALDYRTPKEHISPWVSRCFLILGSSAKQQHVFHVLFSPPHTHWVKSEHLLGTVFIELFLHMCCRASVLCRTLRGSVRARCEPMCPG